jgi:two-component system, OmpR family, response regulator CpxR
MSVIALFSGSYCQGEEVARKVAENLGYQLINDQALIADTSKRFQLEENKLFRAMAGKTSIFNKFTHEKERSLVCLKLALAELLKQDKLLILGYAAHLLPRDVSHVLKVGIVADMKFRIQQAKEMDGLAEKEALKKIHKDDEQPILWVEYWFSLKDPWAVELYDILIPMDKSSVAAAIELICANIQKDVLKVTAASQKAVADFGLAAQVEQMLVKEGHHIAVECKDANITLTINQHVLKLAALEEELKKLARVVPGVQSVTTKVGPGYYKTDIYRKFDFEVPSKVLLVDDEREFAQMLSDRLQMRDLGTAVVYDGEQALSLVDQEEPEVMVLDLKMPGIDGIEVLRRVKSEHPDVEVIVLTGHGSREIEKLCMEMGACAYLEKPVDIETLTNTMKEAYRKLREKKAQ